MLKEERKEGEEYLVQLSEEMSFLNKGSILQMLNHIPANSKVVIDGSNSRSIHYDIVEIIQNYMIRAKDLNIQVELKAIKLNGNHK